MSNTSPDAKKPVKKQSRLKTIRDNYQMTRKGDPRIGLILLGTFLVAAVIAFGLLWLVPGSWVIDIVTSAMVGLIAALIVFSRRAQKSAYRQIEGQPGAAAAALGTLRRGWKSDPAIAFNKDRDIVHRVVGPPGIVLIGEGNPNRVRTLLANERRRHARVAADTPIHEVISGDSEGAVPIPKLARHVTKLGRAIKPAEMTDVLARLKALDANRSAIPVPKGPMPTSMKGQRGNLRGR
jgi:hypothetical protein